MCLGFVLHQSLGWFDDQASSEVAFGWNVAFSLVALDGFLHFLVKDCVDFVQGSLESSLSFGAVAEANGLFVFRFHVLGWLGLSDYAASCSWTERRRRAFLCWRSAWQRLQLPPERHALSHALMPKYCLRCSLPDLIALSNIFV